MKKLALMLLLLPVLVCAQPPANDAICSAITIPVVSGSACATPQIYSWKNATFSPSGVANPTCGWNGSNKEVWFHFVASATNASVLFSQAYDVTHDLAAAVYDGESCSFISGLVECNDDDGPDNYPQISMYNLMPGTNYYIRLWQYNTLIDSGSARICVVSEPLNATGKMGVNTAFPSATLDVNGVLKMRGGSPGVNKVLTSDAYGNATWQPIPPPVNVAFGTYQLPGVGQSIPSSVYTKVLFGEPEELGVANVAAGVFTAPQTANYHFEAAVCAPVAAGINIGVRIVIRDGGTIVRVYEVRDNNAPASSERTMTVSATTRLNIGYTAEVQFFHTSGGAISINASGSLGVERKTRFQGHKIF